MSNFYILYLALGEKIELSKKPDLQEALDLAQPLGQSYFLDVIVTK